MVVVRLASPAASVPSPRPRLPRSGVWYTYSEKKVINQMNSNISITNVDISINSIAKDHGDNNKIHEEASNDTVCAKSSQI